MPLPPALRSAVLDPRFWSGYFWEEVSGSGRRILEPCVVDFPVADDFGLVLFLGQEFLNFDLSLRAPGLAEPAEIAWDDQAHWLPHVLRWEELELIGRCVALQDASLPHPGLTLLLLCRFAPICVGDDLDVIRPMLEAAWRGLGICSESEIGARIDRLDLRLAHIIWEHREPFGWFPTQPEEIEDEAILYTLRNPEALSFPFGPWADMLEAAQVTCESAIQPEWLVGSPGTELEFAL